MTLTKEQVEHIAREAATDAETVEYILKAAEEYEPEPGIQAPPEWMPGLYRTPEREQFLADILITAVEDGCTNYWRQIESGSYEFDTPTTTRCVVIEVGDERPGEEAKYHAVTIDTIDRGFARLHNPAFNISKSMLGPILADDATNGATMNCDAYDADAVLQAGLFGELIYG